MEGIKHGEEVGEGWTHSESAPALETKRNLRHISMARPGRVRPSTRHAAQHILSYVFGMS